MRTGYRKARLHHFLPHCCEAAVETGGGLYLRGRPREGRNLEGQGPVRADSGRIGRAVGAAFRGLAAAIGAGRLPWREGISDDEPSLDEDKEEQDEGD